MMKAPPLLPEEVLARVGRIARVDGLSVAAVAGSLAVVAAVMGDGTGTLVGALVAGAGGMELHGAARLRRGAADGVHWLVGSQLALLGVILAYCAHRLAHPDLSLLRRSLTADLEAQLELIGWTPDAFLGLVYRLVYTVVGGVTLLYQGGLAIYYWRRRGAVRAALPRES